MSYPWQLVLDEFYDAGHINIFILSEISLFSLIVQ